MWVLTQGEKKHTFLVCAAFASSVFAPAFRYIGQEYHVSTEVATLGISLFILGTQTVSFFLSSPHPVQHSLSRGLTSGYVPGPVIWG